LHGFLLENEKPTSTLWKGTVGLAKQKNPQPEGVSQNRPSRWVAWKTRIDET
jgi:hypothetical protein